MPADATRGLVDTNVLVLRRWIDPAGLPDELAVSAVTLAELAAGVHLVTGEDEAADAERARRLDILQRAESEFDPIPFDAEAARYFGRLAAAVRAAGRTPRRRVADLMIAATAAVAGLPLYTTTPDDFDGLGSLVTIVALSRPTTVP
jgi:predicted nucleic acid-binding protein